MEKKVIKDVVNIFSKTEQDDRYNSENQGLEWQWIWGKQHMTRSF